MKRWAGLVSVLIAWSIAASLLAESPVVSGFSRTVIPVVSGFSRTSAEATAVSSAVTLSVAGRSNATPSMAIDGEVVAIAWSASLPGGSTDIFLATSADGGRTFTAAVRVNDVDGDARVNGEQPPRVAVQRAAAADPPRSDGLATITVVWTTKGAAGTKLVHARSTDGGRTFSRAVAVPGADAAGNRGWEALAIGRRAKASAERNRDAVAFVVWLDHRELANQDGLVASTHHQHGAQAASPGQAAPRDAKPDGVAMAQRSRLYLASLDGALAPRALTGGVCYCCKTALATGADGSIYTAWRHVYPGNIRDIAFTRSRDGGRTFAEPLRVSEDRWVLEGCPDDGPAMAIDAQNRIHIVWPTLITEAAANAAGSGAVEPTKALFYAMSTDGRGFTMRQRIPTEGMPHHPQIAVGANGSLAIAWDEVVAGKRRTAFAQAPVAPAGDPRFARRASSDPEAGTYPVVAASTSATLVAWTATPGPASVIKVVRIE